MRRWRVGAALSALLVAGASAPLAPVHDAATGAAVPGARLVLSPAYVVLAPWCDLADTIAGLPLHVHYALMLALLVTGVVLTSTRGGGRTTWAAAARAARTVGVCVGLVLAVYVGVTLVPRPTAHLVLDDPDAVVVDFHSHTLASHDGRRGYTADANRAWHSATGFDVAYVTDHGTFASATAAAAGNPARAGDGTVLLPGVEVRHDGQHLNVIGTTPAESLAYAGGGLDERVFAAQAPHHAEPRVVLVTVPADLGRLDSAHTLASAIELSDAAPRGLQQSDRARRQLVAIARRLDLAVLAGSDDHGWATNAVAWSVLRIPGWRAMSPAALDDAIRRTIRTRRYAAVQVVERRAAPELEGAPGSAMDGALGAPGGELAARLWALCRTLSWPERLAWLAWLWVPWLVRRSVSPASRERATT